MSLEKKVMDKMKQAMKAKDTLALASLRSVKSELLKAKTSADSSGEMTTEDEIKLLQRLVKQRKDSAQVYAEQGRDDLAEPELKEAKIIEAFLPEQLSDEEVNKAVESIIKQTGASSMKDMGKVMGLANKELAGKADGKRISTAVKAQLS
ncbi:MAG: GatB/YqeY domain-containing protein [Psychroflexus maritimus]